MEMQRVFVAALQVVLARQHIREIRDVVIAESFFRYCRNVRAQLSFTRKYVSVTSNCRALPSTMILSSRLVSRLLRWNEYNNGLHNVKL